MPTANIFNRVMQIEYSGHRGTAFTIEVDKRQYLVTARHLLVGIKPGDTIRLKNSTEWATVPAKLIKCPTNSDIAVLIPPARLTTTFAAPPTTEGILWGQDVFFLGFPYGLHTPMENFNVAFLKKGVLSSIVNTTIYLDGHNNPGFSGGPIVFNHPTDRKWHIAGVISGYLWTSNQVVSATDTNSFVQDNTGIVIGEDIRIAVEAIRENPIGPLVAE